MLDPQLRSLRACGLILAAVFLLAAAPKPLPMSFAPATQIQLSNGVLIASQFVGDAALVSAQIFLPAGLTQQNDANAGIAAITAAVVLRTPVEGGKSLSDIADKLGALVSYTLEPNDTRFSIECRPTDFSRLLHGLALAVARPDASYFEAGRRGVVAAVASSMNSAPLTALDMIRQVRYRGTGYAYPDGGRSVSLSKLTPSDLAFATGYRHGLGTVIALDGALTPEVMNAVRTEFATVPASAPPAAGNSILAGRDHEVIAHRKIATSWIAVGYSAPSQYSADFPAMLVVQALLGRGGSADTLAFGSNIVTPSEYVGAYYQFEAQPGTFVVFINGAGNSMDEALRNLQMAVGRMRTQRVASDLISRAKRVAIGDYFTSIKDLSDAAWLLGRSAKSPRGVVFENELPLRIWAVTPADVNRVARQYLSHETTAIILPASGAR